VAHKEGSSGAILEIDGGEGDMEELE